MYVIAASNINRILKQADYKERNELQKKVYAKNGLSFNKNSRSKLKIIQNILNNNWLSKKKLIIWHDIISNSITKHYINRNKALTTKQLIEILTNYKENIEGIVYTQLEGTPNILEDLRATGIITIDIKKQLLRSNRRKQYEGELTQVHPKIELEKQLLAKVLKQENFSDLTKKQRSKTRKRKNRKPFQQLQ
jgi:hypothetical protein